MGVFGLVNGQWQFFPNVAAAQAAGAVNISRQPELRHKPGGPPRDPRMYWDEMTGQWRFPQPDGSTPGKMPSFDPGDEIAPFPPGDEIAPFPPGGVPPTEWNPFPPQYQPPGSIPEGPPQFDPPVQLPVEPIVDYPDPTKPSPEVGNPFEKYVMNYKDLSEAYKRYKSHGGTGDITTWGKGHYDKYGRNEKRKLPGNWPTFPQQKPVPETVPKKPDWGKYLSSNPDLMKAFGTDTAKAKQHWAQFGSKEKRKFTPYA